MKPTQRRTSPSSRSTAPVRAARHATWLAGLAVLAVFSCRSLGVCCPEEADPSSLPPIVAGQPLELGEAEVCFANARRLTFEGANAEAYWSFSGNRIIFQATRGDLECDQIFTLNLATGELRQQTHQGGRTTCSYFLPGDRRFLFSSTHVAGPECPERPPHSRNIKEYVWPIYAAYDIFLADVDGGIVQRLTDTDGYDAEATVSPRGDRIVFTSVRDGDIEIYSMALDGSDVRRLTHSVGYDGGPFFSPSGDMIVFRSQIPETPEEVAHYRELLSRNLVNPTQVELYRMNADGSGRRALTNNGAANFAPCFTPDGRRVVFSSNLGEPDGVNFQLYSIDLEGKDLRQLTHEGTFNCFPHFSPDGQRVLFITNRFAQQGFRTYDIVVADWRGDEGAARVAAKAP